MSFRYPWLYFILMVPVIILVGGIATLFLIDALFPFNLNYFITSAVIFLFTGSMIGLYARDLTLKVEATEQYIRIRKLFKTFQIDWENITEFGKYVSRKERAGRIYVYYVKSRDGGDRRIKIGTDSLIRINELITIIFSRAGRAKFVILLNTSILPFRKKFEPVEWNNDTDSWV